MTPREFYNAWIGWNESRNEKLKAQRDIAYGAAKYHAVNTSWSKKQQRQINNQRFPWQKDDKAKKKGLSVHQKIGSFIRREEHRQKRKQENG
jgi:hypothetical protein